MHITHDVGKVATLFLGTFQLLSERNAEVAFALLIAHRAPFYLQVVNRLSKFTQPRAHTFSLATSRYLLFTDLSQQLLHLRKFLLFGSEFLFE